MSLITLTTDFGSTDWFAGVMRGVILKVNPRGTIVDITHGIPPGDIRAGAFALYASCRLFPKGTVHVAVVDPGVGSSRKAIAVRTSNYFLVGPDNGLLSWALRNEEVEAIHGLENDEYFLHPVSRTFHGRDIFGPVAAYLSRGVPLRKFGAALEDYVHLPWPEPVREEDSLQGEVLYIDRFGNAITNVGTDLPAGFGATTLIVYKGRRRLCAVADFYETVASGGAVAVPGSCGLLEIAINGGRADRRLGLQPGDVITLRPHRP